MPAPDLGHTKGRTSSTLHLSLSKRPGHDSPIQELKIPLPDPCPILSRLSAYVLTVFLSSCLSGFLFV